MITPIHLAWEGLSNAMRMYVEASLRFEELRRIDQEEAVNNGDRAMEFKLEKFHALYDVTNRLPGFDFFGHGDTSLLIVLRNALHHRDHSLFKSWNAHIGLDDGFERLSGAAYLLGSTTPNDESLTSRYYFPLHDFYARLSHPKVQRPEELKLLWDNELSFKALAATAAIERYPEKHVYVDVMPAFMSAMSRVSHWLAALNFQPSGYDGKVYYEHFRELSLPNALSFKHLQIP